MPKPYLLDQVECVPLSKSEEKQLITRLRTEARPDDRDRLITSNLRFVVAVARQFRGFGVPFEDLVNEGNLGLIEAVGRYDPMNYATESIVRKPGHFRGGRVNASARAVVGSDYGGSVVNA